MTWKVFELPKEVLKYVHPVYKGLNRKKVTLLPKRKQPTKLSTSLRFNPATYKFALKRKRVWLRYEPRANVALFYCSRCQLNTHWYQQVLEHHCTPPKKKTHDGFHDNEQIAQNAYKSSKVDALAAMERMVHPSYANLMDPQKIPHPTEPVQIGNVLRLDELCARGMEVENEIEEVPLGELFYSVAGPSGLNEPGEKSLTGYLCTKCKQLYESFSHFNDHVVSCIPECVKDFIPIDIDPSHSFTSRISYNKMRHLPLKRDVSHVACTACGAKNFASTGELHEHIMKCYKSIVKEEVINEV